jgi:FkbM family methyltransferase
MLRTIAELLSRKVILRRRLPSRVGGGKIYVSPDASLKFWKLNLDKTDPALFDWAKEIVKKDDVVWDIGANVGLFTFAAANLAGSKGYVIAVEADIKLADLLRRSARCLSVKSAPVDVLHVAVSDKIDIAKFVIAVRGRSTNHLEKAEGSTQTGGVRETETSVTVTLDWMLERLPPPNVLKIDVESAEHYVLQGAQKILSQIQPTILCEVHSANQRMVGEFLRSHGYTLIDLDVSRADRKSIEWPSFNTLAIPK